MYQDLKDQIDLQKEVSSVLNALPASITRVDLNERFIFVNDSNSKYFGPASNILGKTMYECFGKVYFEFQPHVVSALKGIAVEFEWKFRSETDGLVHYFIVNFTPEKDPHGKVKGFISSLFNIDSLKKSKEALKSTQQHLNLALEAGRMGTWEVDLKTQILTGSEHLLAINGIETIPENLVAAMDLTVHPEDKDGLLEVFAKIIKNHTSFEHHYRIIRPSDGAIRWLEGHGQCKYNERNEPICLMGVVSDITERKLLTIELENARQELYDFFMQAPIPMFILEGPEHIFTLTNSHYENFIGRKVMGKKLNQAFTFDEISPFISQIDNVFKTGTPYLGKEIPIKLKDKNGQFKLHVMDLGYYPSRNSDGEIKGVLGIIQDISESFEARKKIEATVQELANERNKLESIFQNSPAVMALWRGQDMIFEKANPLYVALFGGRQLVGRKIVDAIPELKGQPFVELLQNVFNTGEPFIGIEMLSKIVNVKNGPLVDRYFDFTYLPVFDSDLKPYGVYSHAIDVTDRVISRKILLENEVQLRAHQEKLEEAKLEAERSNRLKSAFLANMSHEIRTPLGIMLGFADLISDSDISNDIRAQYAETLKRNGNQLSLIINDILDLSKVEAGHLKVEAVRFSFQSLIKDIISSMDIKASEKGLKLIYKLNFFQDEIVSDPTRLTQILFNVIGNAIKFTNKGEITILTNHTSEKLEIEIIDTGTGISEQQKINLFKPFHQADETITRKFGGTGLGLTLSRRLAQLLGGDLVLKESHLGQGSIFKLDINVNLLESGKASLTQKNLKNKLVLNNESLDGVSVLLVEDSLDNQELITFILTKAGAKVDLANNGVEGVSKALTGHHDLVLMDVQMPILDGYSATEKLREAGFEKPIIALTAHAMSDIREKCLDVGFTDYLPKPLDSKKLIQTLAVYFNKIEK